MSRKIEILFDAEMLDDLIDNTSVDEVYKAIAYLSTWNMSGIEHATLWVNAERTELTATYYRSAEPSVPPAYAIGAVWHEDHFGFHS